MNNLIKDRIREKKDQIKSLELKKETFKDKIKMQKVFIEELAKSVVMQILILIKKRSLS
jgi:hypothetical protein